MRAWSGMQKVTIESSACSFPTRHPMTDVFELSLQGGAVERQYRRACPEADAMPWGTIDLTKLTRAQIDAALLGSTRASRQEFDSTSVHARVVVNMTNLRLPVDLIAMIARFQVEELVHAELAARLAMELGGGASIPNHLARRAGK